MRFVPQAFNASVTKNASEGFAGVHPLVSHVTVQDEGVLCNLVGNSAHIVPCANHFIIV